ncbi:c-type cytochrome biogenesis protein CcmI [Thiohalobacter sp.]|uniref:c-type cytochrome biogenesis protein CcmI n=1 Tax=Thiohalobacter sp. TaxID=2025948 RepID=UPI00260466AC|nr:c-type cytochrome biogenesis protein CcmI [Thiohalobacter sp.]
MTVLFWGLAIALGLVTGLVLAWPLWRGAGAGAPARDAINVTIARERLAELEAERAAGRLDAAAHASARRDLEAVLAADLEQAGAPAEANGAARRGWAVLILLGVPLASLGLYLQLGAPDALAPQPAAEASPHGAGDPMAGPSMQMLVEGLARRLEQAPNDPGGWLMLARSYKALGRYPEAVEAYRKLLERVGDDADVLAGLVDALALARGGRFDAETRTLLARALAADPDHVMALWLAARADLETGDGPAALAKLDRLMPRLAGDAEATRILSEMRRRARAMAGVVGNTGGEPRAATAAGAIHVRVSMDPALRAQVPDDAVLFVHARAEDGPSMPLVVVRRSVADLPLELVLDDRLAMTPGLRLSAFERVRVGARVSLAGNATAQPGDPEGEVRNVRPGSPGPIEIRIDRQVP